jgi:hypothetical protein
MAAFAGIYKFSGEDCLLQKNNLKARNALLIENVDQNYSIKCSIQKLCLIYIQTCGSRKYGGNERLGLARCLVRVR